MWKLLAESSNLQLLCALDVPLMSSTLHLECEQAVIRFHPVLVKVCVHQEGWESAAAHKIDKSLQ